MPLYTVRRVRKDDTRYGPEHGADDEYQTLCGLPIGEHWWIETNNGTGTVTCPKCKVAHSAKEV